MKTISSCSSHEVKQSGYSKKNKLCYRNVQAIGAINESINEQNKNIQSDGIDNIASSFHSFVDISIK